MMSHDPRLFALLPAPERALLWCLRAWVIGHCEGRSVSHHVTAVLARFGAEEALGELDGFMDVLGRGARRTININCICYDEVSDDERALLDVFAFEQRHDHRSAGAAVAGLVTRRAAPLACDRAGRLMLAFMAAGNVLAAPIPDGSAWHGGSVTDVAPARTLH